MEYWKILAVRLLQNNADFGKIDAIVDFLCSESGSHDYTINRREAAKLGLNVEKCSDELYTVLWQLRYDFSTELLLRTPYDMNALAMSGNMAEYKFTRALIESVEHGAHHFITSGIIETTEIIQQDQGETPLKHLAIRDQRKYDGCEKVT